MQWRHCLAWPRVPVDGQDREGVRMLTQMEALALTLAIELPVLAALGWWWRWPMQRVLWTGLLASGLTHPAAWQMALASAQWILDRELAVSTGVAQGHADEAALKAYHWAWLGIESIVVLAEAVVLRLMLKVGVLRCLLASVAANALSALAGWWL